MAGDFDALTIDAPAIVGDMFYLRRGLFSVGASLEGAATTYRMRAYDSGSGGRHVYWTSTTSPDITPDAADTTPTTAGSLSAVVVVGTG